MNKDRVKGTIDEVVGSAKRKAGKWTVEQEYSYKCATNQRSPSHRCRAIQHPLRPFSGPQRTFGCVSGGFQS
jgi:hypothetical protein